VNRPLIPLSISFALGIFLSRWDSWQASFLLFPLFAIAAVIPFIRKNKYFAAFLIAGFFLLGALAESGNERNRAESSHPFRAAGRVKLTGTVASWPEITRIGKRETLSFVLLNPQAGKMQTYLINSRARPVYGDTWQLYGTLSIPEPALYPGQFDYRRFLEAREIHYVFNGFGYGAARFWGRGAPSLPGAVIKIREAIKDRIDRFFPFPEREIMAALLIGFQRMIPYSIRDDFARTGTAHLLAVSGLNVSIVGGLLYFLLRFLLPRKVNAFFSLCLVFFYAAISGFNAPVLRAAIMGGILLAGIMIDKDPDIMNSLAAAFLILMLMNVEHLFSAGFQLSFLSVLGMILLMPREKSDARAENGRYGRGMGPRWIRAIVKFFKDILTATFAATVATLPMVLYYFRIVSPVSFLANLVLVPLMNFATFLGFVTLPLFFINPDWAEASSRIPLAAVKAALAVNSTLARLPFASFHAPSPHPVVIGFYYAAFLAILFLSAESKKRLLSPWAAGCLAISLTVASVYGAAIYREPTLKIHALHLKQGSVALIEFPGRKHNLLVNTGKSRPGTEWDRIVKPFLISRGIQTVDTVILSSCLVKNSGGLEELLDEFHSRTIGLPLKTSAGSQAEKKVLALLRQKRLSPVFLSHGRLLENYAGVSIRWLDKEGPALELRYRGKRGVIYMEEAGLRTFQGDFSVHLSGREFNKSLVESFCLR